MRDLLSKAMTGSMIAGAALLVAACGTATETEANNAATMNGLEADPTYDGSTNDITAIDAVGNGSMDGGLGSGMGNDAGTATGAAVDADADASVDSDGASVNASVGGTVNGM